MDIGNTLTLLANIGKQLKRFVNWEPIFLDNYDLKNKGNFDTFV